MDRVNIIEANDDTMFEDLEARIYERFIEFKKENMLICNRFKNSSFLNIFKDSLYAYSDGSILIERFYLRDKCTKYPFSSKVFKKEDAELITEFKAFSETIPDIHDLSESEVADYNEKVNYYQQKMGSMIPEVKTAEVYQYDDNLLMELSSMEDEFIKTMSTAGAKLFFNLTNIITWEDLQGKGIVVMGIPQDNYIDVVVTYANLDDNNIEIKK